MDAFLHSARQGIGYDLTLLSLLLFFIIGPFLAAGYRLRQELSATISYRWSEGYAYAAVTSVVFCVGLLLTQYLYLLSIDAILDRWFHGVFLRLPAWWYVLVARDALLQNLGLEGLSSSLYHAVAWSVAGTITHLVIGALWKLVDLPMTRAQERRVDAHLKSKGNKS